jgi:hypothetical protein
MHYVRSITGVLSDHLIPPGSIEVHGSLYLRFAEAPGVESLGDCYYSEGQRQEGVELPADSAFSL